MTRSTLLLAGACAALPLVTHAGTPSAAFDYATIVGQGLTIQADRVPVTTSAGKILYKDVTIEFTVDGSGNLQLAEAPVVVPSPKLITNHFKAGTYFANIGGTIAYATVAGGVNGDGGSTEWNFVIEDEPNPFPAPPQANWQTGAPPPDLLQRIQNAKIVIDPNLSYGTNQEQAPGQGCDAAFNNNGLVAAKQVGNGIAIWSYTPTCGGDQSSPIGPVIFTACSDKSCSNSKS